MVYARTKLTIAVDVFRPKTDISINYSGPTPEKYYNKIRVLLAKIFEVPDEYIQEQNYTWEKSGNKSKFSFSWMLTKDFDKFTFIQVSCSLKGTSEAGHGSATITFEPTMYTEYPQDTLYERSILYEIIRRIHDTFFYQKTREKYALEARRLSNQFAEELKKFAEELRHSERA